MRVVSNAHFWQAEVVHQNRWELGPLELVFVDERLRNGYRTKKQTELSFAIHEWNQSSPGGLVRPPDALDILRRDLPGWAWNTNPNVVFVPRRRANGLTALHTMLASVLPDSVLTAIGVQRTPSLLNLSLVGTYDLSPTYPEAVGTAFSKYIWLKLAPHARLRESFFSARSPLRLLAGDTSFWMHRLYRIALDRWEEFGEVDDSREPGWRPIHDLARELSDSLPEDLRPKVHLRRPLHGGDLWDVFDPEEREFVVEEAISGAGVMESLEPIVECLNTHRAHEDFSDRYSWVKEDFERSFYSKRSKLKVDLVETVDDAPAWSATECEGYERVLFRDVVAFLDVRERRLLVALRMGRTVGEIAAQEGLSGHAAISRRVKRLKQKIARLLH